MDAILHADQPCKLQSDGGKCFYGSHCYERYFKPGWLKPVFAPEEPKPALPTGSTDGVRARLSAAVQKRLMSDVGYGLLLSGGLDSAIVAKLMSELTDMSKIMSFTVGQANSPDIMAARAIAEHFGTDHHEFIFSSKEVLHHSPPPIGTCRTGLVGTTFDGSHNRGQEELMHHKVNFPHKICLKVTNLFKYFSNYLQI